MEEFVRQFEVLDKQCGYFARHLGHVKALIDNDDWLRVVDDSITGRVLLMGNTEITNALILFNSRMFDHGADTCTVYKLSRSLPSCNDLAQHHEKRMAEIGVSYSFKSVFEARTRYVELNKDLKRDVTQKVLQRLRDTVLAHNILSEDTEDHATLNDLIGRTEKIFELVGRAGYMVKKLTGNYTEFVTQSELETSEFFRILPSLKTAERI